MWVEILTEDWHTFDTTGSGMSSFQVSYDSLRRIEGVNYDKIDYYYEPPDTRKGPNIILKDTETNLLKDIHEIKLIISNEGDVGKEI
jgi:hypothetical protein